MRGIHARQAGRRVSRKWRYVAQLAAASTIVFAVLISLFVQPAVAAAAPSTAATAQSLPHATVTIDGVTVNVESPVLPATQFSAPLPDQSSQQAIMTSLFPYKELSIMAVPLGTRSGFDEIAATASGGAAAYRQALKTVRASQKAQVLPAPAASIFGQQTSGSGSLVDLPLYGIRYDPAVVVEWVSEAGLRVWVVRMVVEAAYAQAQPGGVRGFVGTLAQVRLTSTSLGVASTLLQARNAQSASSRPPRTASSASATQPAQALAPSVTLPFPSWWNGTCDANAHGSPTSYPLGDSYEGVPACGPRPAFDNCGNFCDYPEHFYSGAWGELEWECVELVMRYMYLGYGVNPYGANGNQVVANYSGSALTKVTNGSGQDPVPGDVISFNDSNAAGHTAVVASSSVSNGNGTIHVLQQNFGGNGYGNSNDLMPMTVSGGVLQDVNGLHATGWLHSGASSGSSVAYTWAAPNANGTLQVMSRDTNSTMEYAYQCSGTGCSNGWSSWTVMGTTTFNGNPAIGQNADGHLEAFARGSDNTISHSWEGCPNCTTNWHAWSSSGTNTFSGDPAIARNVGGTLEAFAIGTDGFMYHQYQLSPNGGWSPWYPIDSNSVTLAGTPVVGINADGHLEVFAIGTDGQAYHSWQCSGSSCPGGWHAWDSTGNTTQFSVNPAISRNPGGTLEVFAWGADHTMWHAYQTSPNGGWSSWSSLGGNLSGAPAVGQNADGHLEALALQYPTTKGAPQELWHTWQCSGTSCPGGWHAWDQIGGNQIGDPAIVANSDGRLEAFSVGQDSTMDHVYQTTPNGGWSTVSSLGGSFQA